MRGGVLLYRASSGVLLEVLAVRHDQRRRLLHAVLHRELGVVLGVELLIGEALLVQHRHRESAVGAGRRREEQGRAELVDVLGGLLRGGGDVPVEVRLLAAAAGGLRVLHGVEVAVRDVVGLALLVLLRLARVPVLHRAVVAGDAAVHLGALAAVRAGELLAGEVAVVFADGVGGYPCKAR